MPSSLRIALRILAPAWVASLYYYLKFRAKVSPRAEVEMSPDVSMGRDCTISSFTKLKATEGPVTMGDGCGFATGCFLSAGVKGIKLGDHVLCGPNVVMASSSFVLDELDTPFQDQGHTSRGIVVGDNCWIGAGTAVLDGARIGSNTVVVANSLVNRRYPDNVILQGNPAKIILRRGGKREQ